MNLMSATLLFTMETPEKLIIADTGKYGEKTMHTVHEPMKAVVYNNKDLINNN